MTKETTKEAANRRKRKRAARFKRRLMVALLVLVIILFIILLVMVGVYLYKKWEARYDSNTSVLFILEDGEVVSNDVIAFDTNKYSQTELEQFIEDTIDTYNDENGKNSVVQKEFTLENNVVSLILTYADAKTYADFSGNELFVGSISEAVQAGYKFDGKFASIIDEKAVECSIDKFFGQKDLKVAIIKANTKVSVDGEIMYLSAENVSSFGENWIVTKNGCNLLGKGNESKPEPGTEKESEKESTSIDNSEPEQEPETSTEIIFDFGDEEVPEAEDTYSEVYTYIIFR